MKKLFILIVLGAVGTAIYAFKTYDLNDVVVKARTLPDHERSAQIQFRVGQLYWLRSDYHKASDTFTQLLLQYPTCQHAPTALYRLAHSQQQIRHWPEAREAYVKLFKYYPNSKHQDMAEKKYEAIRFRNGEDTTDILSDAFTQIVWEEVKR